MQFQCEGKAISGKDDDYFHVRSRELEACRLMFE